MNDSPEKGRGRPGRPSQTAYPGEPNAWPADWFRVPSFSPGANQVSGHCAAGVNVEAIGPHTAIFRGRWGQADTSDCGCSAVMMLCGVGGLDDAVRTPGHGLSVSGDYPGAIPAVAVAVAVVVAVAVAAYILHLSESTPENGETSTYSVCTGKIA